VPDAGWRSYWRDLQGGELPVIGEISPDFLKRLFQFIIACALSALSFIWMIDPYGAAPFHFAIPGLNALKPKRVDIDRVIKPYEVLRYQPRTIFMGTSRINESLDPGVLDETDFSPAYNAAIPASEVNEEFGDLEQYLALDRSLRAVFLEVFFYNYARGVPAITHKSLSSFANSVMALNFSTSAFWDAVETVVYNQTPGTVTADYTSRGGMWVPHPWFDTGQTFVESAYIAAITRIHKDIADMQIQLSAFAALDRIVALCAKHGVKLYLIIAPNYPWDDYRLLTYGYWSRIEDFYRRLARYPNVVSFSQYNDLLAEPAGHGMRYWLDPIHFNSTTGRLMLRSLAGLSSDVPANFMRRITTETVEAALAERRAGLELWMKDNPGFMARFDAATGSN
jgi:hypothetical protein